MKLFQKIVFVFITIALVGCGSSDKRDEPADIDTPDKFHLIGAHNTKVDNPGDHVFTNSWGNPIFEYQKIDVRVQGDEEFRHTPTWDTIPYSGTSAEHSLTARQIWNSGNYPPSSVSYMGTEVGLYVNSEGLTKFKLQGSAEHSIWSYIWDWKSPQVHRPWADKKTMKISFDFKVPFFAQGSSAEKTPIGQVNFVMYGEDLSDPENPLIWCYLINLFDPRGGYTPFVAHDTFSYFASTPLLTSEYLHLVKGQHLSHTIDEYMAVEFHIEPEHFENVLMLLNEGFGEGTLKGLENITLKSVSILLELEEHKADSFVAMGSAFRNLNVILR